jgi:hypothetical protein
MKRRWYEKYRWFFTSSGKLVIGGKSAEQNEELINKYLEKDCIVMHTAAPGSPFAIVKFSKDKINAKDLEEAAIFTASFSRAWREGKKKAEVHIFKEEQIIKEKGQKTGTFTVLGRVEKVNAEVKLALGFQKNRLRAVPIRILKNPIATLMPGRISKEKATEMIYEKLKRYGFELKKEEILNALPTGNFKINFRKS